MTLFVPEWLNLFALCYEIKTNLIIRTETIEAADILSEEGRSAPGLPSGPGSLLPRIARLVHLLVRHARGDAVIPEEEGVSAYALQRGTWQTVLNRFNADPILQEHIGSLLLESWRANKASWIWTRTSAPSRAVPSRQAPGAGGGILIILKSK